MEACHENAKLDGAGPHYVCHMCYFSSVLSVSACIEINSKIHLLLQASNNAHYASTPRSARLKAPDTHKVTAALCTACPPPRPARARIQLEASHHTTTRPCDLTRHIQHINPQDIGLFRQPPLSISALSTCARHSAENTFQYGIPRPRIPQFAWRRIRWRVSATVSTYYIANHAISCKG
jgi:hypothetical protein